MEESTSRSFEILLVEDSPADVRLTKEALREGKIWHNLVVVGDGVEAMAYLRREAPYTNAYPPDIILLDLNLPRKTGHEVLAEIKSDPDLRRIPVIVLTTSEQDEDVSSAYTHRANSYITKPVDIAQFIKVVKTFDEFWFTMVRLPDRRKV